MIEVTPSKPSAITRGSFTSDTQVQLIITPLTGTATGGAPIITYIIQTNGGGSSTTFTTIFGSVNSPALSTTYLYTISGSLNNPYLFRCKPYLFNLKIKKYDIIILLDYAVNRQGNGVVSDETQIIAATIPGAPAQPTVVYLSLQYVVTWTKPTTGATGILIDSYTIEVKTKSSTFVSNSD